MSSADLGGGSPDFAFIWRPYVALRRSDFFLSVTRPDGCSRRSPRLRFWRCAACGRRLSTAVSPRNGGPGFRLGLVGPLLCLVLRGRLACVVGLPVASGRPTFLSSDCPSKIDFRPSLRVSSQSSPARSPTRSAAVDTVLPGRRPPRSSRARAPSQPADARSRCAQSWA